MGNACVHVSVVPQVVIPLTAEEHCPPTKSRARGLYYRGDDGASHYTQPTPAVCQLDVEEEPVNRAVLPRRAPRSPSGSLPPDVAQMDLGPLLNPPPPPPRALPPPRRTFRTQTVKLEYPLYEWTRPANEADYAIEPFQSSYCLKRTTDVQPDNFRALVEQSHMATAREEEEEAGQSAEKKEEHVPAASCEMTKGGGDAGVSHSGESSASTVAAVVELRSPAAVRRRTSRSSMRSPRGLFSFDSMATIAANEAPACPRTISYMSIYGESGGPRSPATVMCPVPNQPINDITSFRPSLTASEMSDLLETASSTVSTLSETCTYGAIMPIGHSQVVDNHEAGAWGWELTSRGPSAYDDLRRTRRVSRGTLPVLPRKSTAHGKSFVGGTSEPLLPPLAVPAPPLRPCARPTPGPQPTFNSPKSTATRSRPFDVRATLGYSALYARRVPSPSWRCLTVLDAEYEGRNAHREVRQRKVVR